MALDAPLGDGVRGGSRPPSRVPRAAHRMPRAPPNRPSQRPYESYQTDPRRTSRRARRDAGNPHRIVRRGAVALTRSHPPRAGGWTRSRTRGGLDPVGDARPRGLFANTSCPRQAPPAMRPGRSLVCNPPTPAPPPPPPNGFRQMVGRVVAFSSGLMMCSMCVFSKSVVRCFYFATPTATETLETLCNRPLQCALGHWLRARFVLCCPAGHVPIHVVYTPCLFSR